MKKNIQFVLGLSLLMSIGPAKAMFLPAVRQAATASAMNRNLNTAIAPVKVQSYEHRKTIEQIEIQSADILNMKNRLQVEEERGTRHIKKFYAVVVGNILGSLALFTPEAYGVGISIFALAGLKRWYDASTIQNNISQIDQEIRNIKDDRNERILQCCKNSLNFKEDDAACESFNTFQQQKAKFERKKQDLIDKRNIHGLVILGSLLPNMSILDNSPIVFPYFVYKVISIGRLEKKIAMSEEAKDKLVQSLINENSPSNSIEEID